MRLSRCRETGSILASTGCGTKAASEALWPVLAVSVPCARYCDRLITFRLQVVDEGGVVPHQLETGVRREAS